MITANDEDVEESNDDIEAVVDGGSVVVSMSVVSVLSEVDSV